MLGRRPRARRSRHGALVPQRVRVRGRRLSVRRRHRRLRRARRDPARGRDQGTPAGGALLTRVVALRGGVAESEHRVVWCVAHPDGSVDGRDAELPVFARSAVKPLQALASVRAGVLERFELAIVTCARVRLARRLGRSTSAASPRCSPRVDCSRTRSRAAPYCRSTRALAADAPALAHPSQLLRQACARAGALPCRGLAAGRLLPRRPPAAAGDARLRRRGLRVSGTVAGGDRRLRHADVRRAAGGARARLRRACRRRRLGPPATAAQPRCARIPRSWRSTARSTPS